MSLTTDLAVTKEIESQPDCWARAADVARRARDVLPAPGGDVAVIGCGTSWFVAMAYAALREEAGLGRTDAFTASEFPARRNYAQVVAISRSGTTTEVADALRAAGPGARTLALTAVPGTPVPLAARDTVLLDFADERSVVQTRFATTVLGVFRASLGQDLDPVIADGRAALAADLDPAWVSAEQIAFLGRGWTVGLAQEAALKAREASLSFTEAYPAMDYRHGPIALAQPGRLVWMFGEAPEGLAAQVAATGAAWIDSPLDPMADLVRAQRLAVARGVARGLDPDHPRHLTRSVILREV
ncbi:MAG: hypothetical protein LBL01_02245 [Bifidobacteriaceae bacterium]|jgi:fructoselysine-6-P-deglycase FrlB-like protein|nr:hypothetical protein [Bifidobacteriaceae bacterium]